METVHNNVGELFDVVYSPDDGGWYIQRHSDYAVSQTFDTREAAVRALATGGCDFD